jgi:ATP-dependent Clp protease adaptor protein ClpS
MASYKYDLEHDYELEEPKKYKVLLLNDDFSTMEFVIQILTNVFRKTIEESEKIMLDVHNNGKAVCGIYTKEIALTKTSQVKTMARKAKFPLKAIAEEE